MDQIHFRPADEKGHFLQGVERRYFHLDFGSDRGGGGGVDDDDGAAGGYEMSVGLFEDVACQFQVVGPPSILCRLQAGRCLEVARRLDLGGVLRSVAQPGEGHLQEAAEQERVAT